MVKSLLVGMLVGVLSVYLVIEIAAAGYRFGRWLATSAPAASAVPASAAEPTRPAANQAGGKLSIDLVL